MRYPGFTAGKIVKKENRIILKNTVPSYCLGYKSLNKIHLINIMLVDNPLEFTVAVIVCSFKASTAFRLFFENLSTIKSLPEEVNNLLVKFWRLYLGFSYRKCF